MKTVDKLFSVLSRVTGMFLERDLNVILKLHSPLLCYSDGRSKYKQKYLYDSILIGK